MLYPAGVTATFPPPLVLGPFPFCQTGVPVPYFLCFLFFFKLVGGFPCIIGFDLVSCFMLRLFCICWGAPTSFFFFVDFLVTPLSFCCSRVPGVESALLYIYFHSHPPCFPHLIFLPTSFFEVFDLSLLVSSFRRCVQELSIAMSLLPGCTSRSCFTLVSFVPLIFLHDFFSCSSPRRERWFLPFATFILISAVVWSLAFSRAAFCLGFLSFPRWVNSISVPVVSYFLKRFPPCLPWLRVDLHFIFLPFFLFVGTSFYQIGLLLLALFLFSSVLGFFSSLFFLFLSSLRLPHPLVHIFLFAYVH